MAVVLAVSGLLAVMCLGVWAWVRVYKEDFGQWCRGEEEALRKDGFQE